VALAPAGGWTEGDESEQRRLSGFFHRTHKLTSVVYPHARTLVTRPRLRKLMFRDVMVHGDRIPSGEAAHIMQSLLECSIFFDLLEAVMRDGPAVDLDQVSCPVLIAWPEKDRIFPIQDYRETFATVPGVEVITLDGCGHVPMYDNPDLVARTLADFAARVKVSEPDSHSASASSVH
jgi:pimeloyl-ACP methyl ester carboxylesterase